MHPSREDGMQKASQENREWERYKEVTVPWITYDVGGGSNTSLYVTREVVKKIR